ncbi:DUF2332 domain-containing protein [Pseudoruegeria sp. HB172150]|uniref:DUF2332 domain-containing protein n=1 Tax=Pseudoruegeria sp. HB172150 TaxID=2721164 RepID=UPI0015520330|nr:DUF2332 family protein [Pseudoruegeria sp. HB172150]
MTLSDALRDQAGSCDALGSPFTARLLTLAADRLRPGTTVTDRLLAWRGELGSRGQSVPLRLAGSLHGLVIDGSAPDLAACYPPNQTDDESLWTAVEAAFIDHETRLMYWLNRPPQTNELGRSAVLIAAGHWLTAEYGLPIVLSELGASAGLNLFWDRYALEIPGATYGPESPVLTLKPDWQGSLPPKAEPKVTARRGTDLTPLDPTNPSHQLRLTAYIWPDQPDRLARTRAALEIAEPVVDAADAADWLETRLAEPHPGQLHLLYHTIAWQYFPEPVKDRARALIEAAGERATAHAPLAWLAMEADDDSPGAGLSLRLWPGDRRIALGRVDFHGRWLRWDLPQT